MIDYYDLYSISNIIVDNVRLCAIRDNGLEKALAVDIMHTHSFYEIFVCVNGEIQIETEDETIILKSNSIAVIPPETRHQCLSLPNVFDWCAVGYTIEKMHHTSTCNLYKRLSMVADNEIVTVKNVELICKNIFEAFHNSSGSSFNGALRICAAIDDIFHYLHMHGKNELMSHEKKPPLPEVTSRIDSLIDFYYAENITLDDISNCLFLSKRQITRIVKKYYNKTFFELLNDKRINVAAYMIEKTEMSIEKISVMSGFSSLNGFYREFKKRHSMTPATYRISYEKTAGAIE